MICGPSGTGKTFLLEALGQQAVEQGLKVACFTHEQLGVLVGRHRADDSVRKAIVRVLRADLVVVDDIGLLAVAQDAAEGLYRLVDAAYEQRSVCDQLEPAPGCSLRVAEPPGGLLISTCGSGQGPSLGGVEFAAVGMVVVENAVGTVRGPQHRLALQLD